MENSYRFPFGENFVKNPLPYLLRVTSPNGRHHVFLMVVSMFLAHRLNVILPEADS